MAFPALKMQSVQLYISRRLPVIPSDSSAFIRFVTVITLSILSSLKRSFFLGKVPYSSQGSERPLSALAAPLSHDDNSTMGAWTIKPGADKSSIPLPPG